jgi:hypothetical protein
MWVHGRVGFGKRLEIPACVRAAISEKFPDPMGNYTSFQPLSGEEYLFDEEED